MDHKEDLSRYEDQCIRITQKDGEVFEGIGGYIGEEWDWWEDPGEDCLVIENIMVLRSQIDSVEILEDHGGPWGKYSGPYGRLEELNIKFGIDGVEEVLDSEEPEHVIRMMNCLEHYLDPECKEELEFRDRIPEALRHVLKYNHDEKVLAKAEDLLQRWH